MTYAHTYTMMSPVTVEDDDWEVDFRPGLWARIRGDGMTIYLELRGGDPGQRELQIHAAAVTADRPVTEAMWRSVPFQQIRQYFTLLSYVSSNSAGDYPMASEAPKAISGYSIEALARYFAETEAMKVSLTLSPPPSGLVKPANGRLTDEFLANVARNYLFAVTKKVPPGPMIAGRAGVPVRTVHRWVAEARRRGMLPQGTKGKAG